MFCATDDCDRPSDHLAAGKVTRALGQERGRTVLLVAQFGVNVISWRPRLNVGVYVSDGFNDGHSSLFEHWLRSACTSGFAPQLFRPPVIGSLTRVRTI